ANGGAAPDQPVLWRLFQYPERMQSAGSAEQGLFDAWREVMSYDRGIGILMSSRQINRQVRCLPISVAGTFQAFAEEVLTADIGHAACADYATALLLDVNGWTSWMAYQVWQDQLAGRQNNLIEQFLAIRLAWELLLWRHLQAQGAVDCDRLRQRFLAQFAGMPASYQQTRRHQALLWVWQRALEYSYQLDLTGKLLSAVPAPVPSPTLQAVFCIDVRSEPMRRALEAQDPGIQTLGFAGFFGLPIEYRSAFYRAGRPQLPGLLSPAYSVSRQTVTPAEYRSNRRLQRQVANQDAGYVAPASFGLVEAGGLFKAFDLLRNSFLGTRPANAGLAANDSGRWVLHKQDAPVSLDEQAQLLASILSALGLTTNFANLVLLAGHGSQSANNPHAAGLDCGACGGQSGEVNVRVLAQMLNDTELRQMIARTGIEIPETTRFVPALHNTSTDEISLFDTQKNVTLDIWLKDAQRLAQKKRAPELAIDNANVTRMAKQFLARTKDWAQLRPEWGLANNASFIVAPRALTRRLDLAGRSFLHDYSWQEDPSFSVLEQIITAPMIVTNWINLQYYASVVDPVKYGSGNKMLHNVVGRNIGVFEGNGGDLRIGLPIQSLHDGKAWRHQPLRLSVYIVAPQTAIADIVERHAAVSELVNNDWLYLFAWDAQSKTIARYYQGRWVPING
ncbi:MAG: DUF2309 domain-containing protein, partial [Pseudohongiella sp.]